MPKHTRMMVRLLRPLMDGGREKQPGDWVYVSERRAHRLIDRGIAEVGPQWGGTPSDNHVLMVSKHNCSRVAKEAWALREKGWRVDSLSVGFPSIPGAFDVMRVVPEEDLATEIAASGAPIIHVHNEPDKLMRYADEGAGKRPIVYDWHDLEYHRFGKVTDDEQFAFDRADGIISTSRPYRRFALRKHPKWKVPDAVVHTCIPRSWAPALGNETQRKGVVYAGGSQPNAPEHHRWRDHRFVAQAFEDAGVRFDLYVPSYAAPEYPHGYLMMPYHTMLKVLPRYKWGFLGMDRWTEKWSVVVPNKLFEYLACGVPILSCNAEAVESYMEGSGCIVQAKTMEKLIERMNDPRKTNWLEMADATQSAVRWMDDEIDGLLQVYDAVIGKYACPYCNKSVKSDFALRGHVRQVHQDRWEEYRALRDGEAE